MQEIIQTTQIQTEFLGIREREISYKNGENISLTKPQQRIVKEFVDNHFKDERYVVLSYHVFVCKYFVGINLSYFPKDSHNTVYTLARKTLYVGPKGGIRRFTCACGISEERNVKELFNYYKKAEDY